jgi:hypothetical protein
MTGEQIMPKKKQQRAEAAVIAWMRWPASRPARAACRNVLSLRPNNFRANCPWTSPTTSDPDSHRRVPGGECGEVLSPFAELPMKKLLGFLVLVALVVGGVGYWRGWFVFKKTDDNDGKPNITVNKDKFQEDKAAFLKAAGAKLKALKEKLEGKRSQSKELTGEDKAKADREIRELEAKHGTLDAKLKDADKAAEGEFEGAKSELNRALDDLSKSGK